MLPSCITIGVRLAVLLGDVTVVIILHRVDNFTVYDFCKKLTESIVGIFGCAVNNVNRTDDVSVTIVDIEKLRTS